MLSRNKRRPKAPPEEGNGASHLTRDTSPLIYSAPTVDTLGDDSSSIRPYATPRPTTAHPNSAKGKGKGKGDNVHVHVHVQEVHASSMWKNHRATPPQTVKKQQRQKKKKKSITTDREFQKSDDAMSVSIRTILVAERSAFDVQPIVASAPKQKHLLKRMSPSPQHVRLIQKLQSIDHVRQLAFSPSVGSSSDVLYPGEAAAQQERLRTRNGRRSLGSNAKTHTSTLRSDGRYRSIDPVQATLSRLPSNPPLLSNKRHRLPMRADVGFHASPEEIQQKQAEINQETEWEEASPRLIVLVTSDDLGTAAIGTRHTNGGLPAMPFAGPELVAAKYQNQQHFSRREGTNEGEKTEQEPGPSPGGTANRYSMLAPPLDATFSSTLGWRPRPFHDRPPGWQYTLVSPLAIEFGAGNLEPLVCSLTLYKLGTKQQPHTVLGKSSEEFYFPAGDWKGKLQVDALQGDEELTQQWLNRKHKALFARDPLIVAPQDLYVLLQVYKVTHLDLAAAYLLGKPRTAATDEEHQSLPPHDRKSWRKRLKMQLQKGKVATPEAYRQQTSYRASAVFDTFGTQLLSPLCFGVTPLYHQPPQEYAWPAGHVQEDITLYAYPSAPESHEDFVQRLCHLVGPTPLSGTASNAGSSSVDSFAVSTATSLISSTDDGRRKGLGRFISPKKGSRKDMGDDASTATTPNNNKKIETTAVIPAKVSLFVSDLQADFLDSLLQSPPELADEGNSVAPTLPAVASDRRLLPKMLVDVSGSCAIMMDPTKDIGGIDANKRSNLVRLPPTPTGYMDASDFREVWFLPPAPPKQHAIDIPPSYRSLVNVLYLYPRLLRQLAAPEPKSARRNAKQSGSRYTVRVRLVESVSETKQESGIVEAHTTPMKIFHNPAPWAGPSLLKSVYTKIQGEWKPEDLKAGIALQDEFKLRLPTMLDGNQFLQFTLCAVDFSDDLDDSISTENVSTDDPCGVSVRHIAEATIPLSSYSTRDPASGNKVTTIIPNGCHRLKLGDFQLQVETRLLSSIHVSDPSLATAFREFPLTLGNDMENNSEGIHEFALTTGSKSTQEKIRFSSLFAVAEPTALMSHFQPLFFMHLANLVKIKDSGGTRAQDEQFLEDCMDSLLEVFSRIREAIFESSDGSDQQRLQAFIKASVDAYDEGYFHSSKIHGASEEEDTGSEIVRVDSSESAEQSMPGEDEEDDHFDGGAIRRRKKDSLRSDIDTRISRTFSAMESPRVGFLRTAYGATKTDRMRLEAELNGDGGRYTHLVDDDETVVTFATGYSGEARMADAREAFERSKTPKASDTSAVKSLSGDGIAMTSSRDFSYKSIADLPLAQRVRSAAKVMLSPCVPPSFFNSSPRNSSWQEEKTILDETELSLIDENDPGSGQEHDRVIATSGSDVDESEANRLDESQDPQDQLFLTTGLALRSPWQCQLLKFSVAFEASEINGAFPLARSEFVYESILLLWLRSIAIHAASKGFSRGSLSILAATSDEENRGKKPLQKMFDNMDFLLPLCLKSLALRFGARATNASYPSTRVIVDNAHIAVFESFFETTPLLLMRNAMVGSKAGDRDKLLQHAIEKSEDILDFLVGLYAIIHPAHAALLTKKFFLSLRYAETEGFDLQNGNVKFGWTEENLYRVRCSRQLRLRAIERLAVLPNFVALNYPMHFNSQKLPARTNKASWINQYAGRAKDESIRLGDLLNDGEDLLPQSGWLAEILTRESLSISALSCEAVVAEAMAHIEENETKKSSSPASVSLNTRPTAALTRDDLLMFQSIAIHGITCVHELLLRRHAMDKRYQKESSRGRIASLFAIPIFEKSLASVRWLARMESTHRVRSLWLLCFTYVLQEAPENLLREVVSSYCHAKEVQIHRFIRLLRLSSSTFQSFIDQQRYCMFPSEIDSEISPWLLQESFNIICATTILVVEECASPTSESPTHQKKMVQGILDLLLHILTTPQSSVTHLRAVGGAIQALERFGVAMFLEITGGSLQHWIRVVSGLMNNIALSVRSIAVDFVVSLLGSSYDLYGSIDELAIILTTVLPEVAAREIGLCSVSGYIKSLDDAEKAIWPLRRSFADLEDTNPLDDDRVDPQLSPVLSLFCRACQAVLDGVLIEMRLQGSDCDIVGVKPSSKSPETYTFDADEESLFEAANFFVPENAPIQRVRWLMTLRSLHKAKGQWVEAAESLIMCARAIADSIPHLKDIWRPSRFPLWSDSRRSLWLSTVGEDLGIPERGNDQVMSFANNFLEPVLFGQANKGVTESGKLKQPTISEMCRLLTSVTREAVAMFEQEGGMDGLAYSRLESLLMVLMDVLEEHGTVQVGFGRTKVGGLIGRRRHVEDEASLRKVIASISGEMTKLAERLLLLVEGKAPSTTVRANGPFGSNSDSRRHYFVRIVLSGRKPTRFTESTTLPTFLEWDTPCICRVPKAFVEKTLANVGRNVNRVEETMCSLFAKPIRNALLLDGIQSESIIFRLGNRSLQPSEKKDVIFVDIGFVQMNIPESRGRGEYANLASPRQERNENFGSTNYDGRNVLSKHFIYRKPPSAGEVISSTFVEVTVANKFPCPLSRQRILHISEFASNK